MYKNIVIFGPDNAGKTSLANQLATITNGRAIHSLGPVPIEDMKNFMETELENHLDVKIFDRFPILEEYVYGNILRGTNRFSDEDYNNTILSKVDLFIFCNPGLFNMLNWGTREQMEGVKENSIELINAFNLLAFKLKNQGFSVVEYNYRIDNPEDLLPRTYYADSINDNLIRCALMAYKEHLNELKLNGCDGLSYSELHELITRTKNLIEEYS